MALGMRPAGAVARALSVPRPGLTMVSLHSPGPIGQGTDASTGLSRIAGQQASVPVAVASLQPRPDDPANGTSCLGLTLPRMLRLRLWRPARDRANTRSKVQFRASLSFSGRIGAAPSASSHHLPSRRSPSPDSRSSYRSQTVAEPEDTCPNLPFPSVASFKHLEKDLILDQFAALRTSAKRKPAKCLATVLSTPPESAGFRSLGHI